MSTVPNPRRKRSSAHTGVREAPESVTRTRYPPGYHIDKYELVRPYGEGGSGTVWVAHDMVLDIHVAIKLISLDDSDEEARAQTQRLLDEARAAARLGHTSIVRVHDFGQTEHGDPYIAMELLDGEDLADLLERQTNMPALESVQLLLPIAHALTTAHEKNIVHRDVKPENIYLSKAEVGVIPKLLDFGIARRVDRPRRLTLEGSLLGTPDYMSPEQARGEPAGPLTDLWSFCVVLYELISGRPPFVHDNYNALLRAIIEERPKTLLELELADAELSSIIDHGLEKEQTQRWASMRDFGEALAQWLLARGVLEDATGTSLRRAWLRDPEGSGRFEISQVAELAALQAASAAHSPQRVPSGPGFAADGQSEPDLEAIAELNRGGDPVELLERAQRRKGVMIAVVLIALVVGAVGGVLMVTGIVAF